MAKNIENDAGEKREDGGDTPENDGGWAAWHGVSGSSIGVKWRKAVKAAKKKNDIWTASG